MTTSPLPSPSGPVPSLRVVSLNLWHNDVSVTARLEVVANELASSLPDVVALQEVRFDAAGDAASSLSDLSDLPVVVSAPFYPLRGGASSGTALLSALPVTEAGAEVLPGLDAGGESHGFVWAWLRAPSGREVLVVSAHFGWGAAMESLRLRQAVALDAFVSVQLASRGVRPVRTKVSGGPPAGAEPVVLLCGDLNSVPDTDTLRFLTGRGVVDGTSTFWLDSWDVVGEGSGRTSVRSNPWAAATARGAGIQDPRMIPERRIDYVLVHGWAYGRPGCPLAARLAFTEPGPAGVLASDHYGVEVDLWDPPLPVLASSGDSVPAQRDAPVPSPASRSL